MITNKYNINIDLELSHNQFLELTQLLDKFRSNSSNEIMNKDTLSFDDDNIIGENTGEVMASYETPLMEKYAIEVNHKNGDLLEIGFGLGLFANKAYSMGVKSYTIVEMHPQILVKLYEWASDKPEVTVIEGDWIDNLDLINSKKYDSIFFDTHRDVNRPRFRELVVDECIKEDGIFGYFNTDANYNPFNYDNLQNADVVVLDPNIDKDLNLIASWVKYPLK